MVSGSTRRALRRTTYRAWPSCSATAGTGPGTSARFTTAPSRSGTGQADDTLVVYTTDNGGSTCNFADNTPLRGTKYTVWEGGIRVPMLWRWPARLPSAQQTDALVSTLDLVPTLVAAAGGEVESDGLNLLPVLNGDTGSAHTALHWDCGFQWAVRDGDWKLSWVDSTDPQVQHLSRYEHAPMGDGWHLANLTEDLGEQHNRLDDEPAVGQHLRDLHAAWRTEVGLDPTLLDDPVGHEGHGDDQ